MSKPFARRERNRPGAQLSWQSTCLTSRGSQVRALLFPPKCAGTGAWSGPVVQLVRTLACHARGQGFESPSGRHFFCRRSGYASVAQLVEQGTENPRVVGSIPTGGTNSGTNVPADENRIVSTRCGFSSFGRARPCQGRGGGFEPRNPLQRTQRCNSVTKKPCPLFIGAIAKR